MEKNDIFDRQPSDPYDGEERCRKIIRAVMRAIFARVAASALLLAAVAASGASAVVLCLTVLVFLIVAAGALPLGKELKNQRRLLRQCLEEQKKLEEK